MKLAIILPAYNEASVIKQVIQKLPKKLTGISKLEILVVDDASTDTTSKISKQLGVNISSHRLNRGAGAATKTGLQWAYQNGFDIAVTFDADGQHNPKDIRSIIKPILDKSADLVIGSRFLIKQKIPFDRLILNKLANIFTFIMFGAGSTDSQSGLRGFSRNAIKKINFKTDRMEFSSEIILEAKKKKLKIVEVPTSAIYTNYSLSKGQKNINAFSIILRLLVKLFR